MNKNEGKKKATVVVAQWRNLQRDSEKFLSAGRGERFSELVCVAEGILDRPYKDDTLLLGVSSQGRAVNENKHLRSPHTYG